MLIRHCFLLLILLGATFNPLVSFADTILTENLIEELIHLPIDEQKKRMSRLEAGSLLIFPNDPVYPHGIVIGHYLGGNAMSAVYEVIHPASLQVIKLPRYFRENPDECSRPVLEGFVAGDRLLKKYRVQSVKINHYLPGYYVAVSRLPRDSLSLDDIKSLDIDFKRQALASLVIFATQTAAFDSIGDLKYNDIHYSPTLDTWTLADWADLPEEKVIYHTLFNPDLPLGLEYNTNTKLFFDLLAVERTSKGVFRRIEKQKSAHFEDIPLSERLEIARIIEKKIIEQRRHLIKLKSFREDAAKYRYLEEGLPPNQFVIENENIIPKTTFKTRLKNFVNKCLLVLKK